MTSQREMQDAMTPPESGGAPQAFRQNTGSTEPAAASSQTAPPPLVCMESAEPGEARVARALLSVSDKSGIVEFARGLRELDVEIVSTGGTARELSDAGLPVRAIEDFTGFPEMMDGRVKTLHPRLYAGLLARRDDDAHLAAALQHGIEQVDLVCVNLYPFEQTIARPDVGEAEAIENIDIGGPTMIRAAAKNHQFAAVLVDPADYEPVLAELRKHDGRITLPTRRCLAARAFALTARYDAAIASWFARYKTASVAHEHAAHEPLPLRRVVTYEKAMDLRYGENPHQRGAYYAEVGAQAHLLSGVRQLHGKELSFNNLLDLAAARELAFDFDQTACAIVKHNNPCGCALGQTPLEAYKRAFACDPMSAFGGVIALNRRVDAECAAAIGEQFVEVLIAPGFEEDALALLTQKKNVRLLELSDQSAAPRSDPGLEARPVLGGMLLQDRDAVDQTPEQMAVISARQPQEREWQDMLFAWRVCMRVRSNAIVVARDNACIGIGAGQMSRVDAVRIAIEKAREFQPDLLAGSALASDAFFPFPDAPQLALDAGVSAIIQPGGSVKDELSVQAVDEADATMVATGVRHFRH